MADSATKEKQKRVYNRQVGKPPYSYVGMIAVAIWYSPQKKQTVNEIASSLRLMFPTFAGLAQKSWRATLRHTLSTNGCFIRLHQMEFNNKCSWTVDLARVPEKALLLQSKKDKIYQKDLLDHLQLPALDMSLADQLYSVEMAASSLNKLTGENLDYQWHERDQYKLTGSKYVDITAKNYPTQNTYPIPSLEHVGSRSDTNHQHFDPYRMLHSDNQDSTESFMLNTQQLQGVHHRHGVLIPPTPSNVYQAVPTCEQHFPTQTISTNINEMSSTYNPNGQYSQFSDTPIQSLPDLSGNRSKHSDTDHCPQPSAKRRLVIN